MALQLYFVPSKLPRTWTQKQWKEAYRWVRMTRKTLDEAMEKNREVIANIHAEVLIYGSAAWRVREDMVMEMVNPPLLLGLGME